MSALAKKIVVFGGNGFLGKRICENAINRGYDVISISGSGKKPKPYENENSLWIDKVNWKKGNIFYPETYINELKNSIGVIHSIGLLLENDSYKKIVGSNDGIINTVNDIFKTPNPMNKNPDNLDNNIIIDKTYKRFNTESAIVLADSLIKINRDKSTAFVYISADRGFPGIPSGYIESKRKAEFELYQLQPNIRPIFIRPGFMFDPSEKNHKSIRKFLKNSLDILENVNKKLLFNSLDGIIRPNISTKVVAKWCIDKIEDNDFRGPVMLDEMINIKK